jgi:hypothetical protein
MTEKHAQLQNTAIKRLYAFRLLGVRKAKEVLTQSGVTDARGVKTVNSKNDVYYIEAKASRSDLICRKQKEIYNVAVGVREEWRWQHDPDIYRSMFADKGVDRTIGWEGCERCTTLKETRADTGIDFYHLIVADGVQVEPSLYLRSA